VSRALCREVSVTWTKASGANVAWQQVDLALRAARTIWLATTRPDGRPHAAPVWFCWDGERIVFSTARGTLKGRNLAAQPWVACHLGDGDDVVLLEGAATPILVEDELTALDQAYGDKYPEPVTGQRATMRWSDAEVVFEVRPGRVVAWSYGNAASRTVWTWTTSAGVVR
jgi:PPOX class probable F420-dependent enzyme